MRKGFVACYSPRILLEEPSKHEAISCGPQASLKLLPLLQIDADRGNMPRGRLHLGMSGFIHDLGLASAGVPEAHCPGQRPHFRRCWRIAHPCLQTVVDSNKRLRTIHGPTPVSIPGFLEILSCVYNDVPKSTAAVDFNIRGCTTMYHNITSYYTTVYYSLL